MSVAEVVRLADLVSSQEGAVVSRTLVHRATGTVTLFAFDVGQGLSEHTTQFGASGTLELPWSSRRSPVTEMSR